jgi:hypothetical protein
MQVPGRLYARKDALHENQSRYKNGKTAAGLSPLQGVAVKTCANYMRSSGFTYFAETTKWFQQNMIRSRSDPVEMESPAAIRRAGESDLTI